jgi:glycosyltransferase involved in cell wall biosynthesis
MINARDRAATPDDFPVGARRILHIVGGLNRGGIELWLLHVLKRIDRRRYQMDFLVVGDRPGTKVQEFERLGSRVILCPGPRRPWRLTQAIRFAHGFRTALRRFGPYDVIHAHIHHYDGFVLRLAAKHQVPIRIAHSHNDTRPAEAGASWPRRWYLAFMKRWIQRYATQCLAVSRSAAEDLFGASPLRVPAVTLLPCGLDFTPFAVAHDRAGLRTELGLPQDALVLGHVGHFHWRKNHDWLLLVAAEAFLREPRARLVLVGDGERMSEIRDRAAALGIAERVALVGSRDDIAAMMQAMDVFVFPSHHEGLGLVLLEAQASGLPCVLSDALPEEADVVPSLIHRLSLNAPPAVWAEHILHAVRAPRPSQADALQSVTESAFEICRSLRGLREVYDRES